MKKETNNKKTSKKRSIKKTTAKSKKEKIVKKSPAKTTTKKKPATKKTVSKKKKAEEIKKDSPRTKAEEIKYFISCLSNSSLDWVSRGETGGTFIVEFGNDQFSIDFNAENHIFTFKLYENNENTLTYKSTLKSFIKSLIATNKKKGD